MGALENRVVSVWHVKNAAAKTVPMSSALAEVLGFLRRGVGAAPVFVRPDGSALTLDDVQSAFDLAKRLTGLREKLTPYTIRHTFAS